ncbi:hypothetical protein QR77_29390 [Streptomyces sp. 150FB]|uniref:hypothetical protein n=1 Tax=Streptomyces sp. 150FB TaxID=1576605 RepID=UPI0005892220|nr:hypothetical protein [Streptomyces sp. 150FB]KIF76855.1 hypothetical protein QR77_29390 [Streptomyces sp. 150FB]
MRVLYARLLPVLAVFAAVAGLVALSFGQPSAASASGSAVREPYGAGIRAETATYTPPVPTPQAPAPGKPSPPAVPSKNPLPVPPPSADPCQSVNGIPASTACSGVAQNQAANDKCQVENFHNCAKPITGPAQETWQQNQNGHAQAQQDFHAVQRDQSAAGGAAELCGSSSGMRDRLSDSDVIVPPSEWWAC